jgi:predicted nucleic acid-binding protein
MLVIDASATADLLLARPVAKKVARHIADHDTDLHVPHLIDIEVVSAIRRVVASGDASPARGLDAITDLLDLPLVRYPHEILVSRIWELRQNFSSYDAAYLALAESLTESGVPLLTTDKRLARATRAHSGVELLAV